MTNFKRFNYATFLTLTICLSLFMFSCSKEEVNLSDLNETIYVRHKNADMPAYIHGNGTNKVFLIILHGGPGGSGLSYRMNTIRTEIEQNNAVVYFDQRSSGNAQGNFSEAEVSLDIMAEDVLALAKMIKAKFGDDSKLFLLGHSWGGALGPAALLKNQEDFAGWIEVAGAHNPKGFYDAYKVFFKETADAQIALGNSVEHWQSVLDLLQDVDPNYNVDDFFRLNRAAHAGEGVLEADMITNSGNADFGEGAAVNNAIIFQWNTNGIIDIIAFKQGLWENVSFTDRLAEITLPSLVLWGKYDLVVPPVFAQEAYDNLGANDKELFFFEQSGHSPMTSQPELFADRVIEFINRY